MLYKKKVIQDYTCYAETVRIQSPEACVWKNAYMSERTTATKVKFWGNARQAEQDPHELVSGAWRISEMCPRVNEGIVSEK
jgi:hypothetical protein